MANPKKSLLKNIIFVVVVTLMLFFIIINKFFPDDSIKYTGFKLFTIITDSMHPDIKVGDIVVDVKVKEEDLQVGDVITFYTYLRATDDSYIKSTVTHYLAAIVENGDEIIYKTHGADVPENSYDEWKDINGNPVEIKFEDIIGRVSFVVPYIGLIVIFLQKIFINPIMIILVIVNISIIVAVVKVTKRALREGKKA